MPHCQKHDFEPEHPTADEPLFIKGPGEEYQDKTSSSSAVEGWTFAIKIVGCLFIVAVCLAAGSCSSRQFIIPKPPEARAVGNVPPPGFKSAQVPQSPESQRRR
jgi:hypothetical protein